jgi:hypothetical protein
MVGRDIMKSDGRNDDAVMILVAFAVKKIKINHLVRGIENDGIL